MERDYTRISREKRWDETVGTRRRKKLKELKEKKNEKADIILDG